MEAIAEYIAVRYPFTLDEVEDLIKLVKVLTGNQNGLLAPAEAAVALSMETGLSLQDAAQRLFGKGGGSIKTGQINQDAVRLKEAKWLAESERIAQEGSDAASKLIELIKKARAQAPPEVLEHWPEWASEPEPEPWKKYDFTEICDLVQKHPKLKKGLMAVQKEIERRTPMPPEPEPLTGLA